MSTFVQYESFLCIVETGSITAAASELNLSVPAVSKQLVQLEESLNVQLFHRSHKKLVITDAGRRFYPMCREILQSISNAEHELVSDQNAIRGKISLTLSQALCRSHVLSTLAKFTARHPEIEFELGFSDEIEDLHSSNIDFALRLGDLADNSNMVATKLLTTRLVACATPAYLEQHGTPESFSSLGSSKFIMMRRLNPHGQLKAFLNKKRFDFRESVAHTADDIECIFQMVKAHMGIGFMLDIAVQKELHCGELVSVLSEQKLPVKPLFLLSKKNPWQTQKISIFKQFFVDELKRVF